MRYFILPTLLLFFGSACSPANPQPDCVPTGTAEMCNGIDDDCDGTTDLEPNGAPLAVPCSTDCGNGYEICEGGIFRPCNAQTPLPEICDGADNDCDGLVDEENCDCEYGERRPCGESVGECDFGVEHCGADGWGDCQLPYDPDDLVEVCGDGLDNDCDGITDEECDCVPGAEQPCGIDEGECVAGVMTCQPDSTWGTECVGSIGPELDICDGLDNDCDGEVDYVVGVDFGWDRDRLEVNETCAEAAPIYGAGGTTLILETEDDPTTPGGSDPSDLMSYPSLYGLGDVDWYYTRVQEETDCWVPFGNDCAFRLTVGLELRDRRLVIGAVQEPEDWRLCVTIGGCTDGTEYCTRGTDFHDASSLYQLSLIWGSGCWSAETRDIKIKVDSPTGLACGFYQIYLWFEYDDTLDCPE